MTRGPADNRILPIPIREDVNVQIYGLPHDLTAAEAEKIARVIAAFAVPNDLDSSIPDHIKRGIYR